MIVKPVVIQVCYGPVFVSSFIKAISEKNQWFMCVLSRKWEPIATIYWKWVLFVASKFDNNVKSDWTALTHFSSFQNNQIVHNGQI